MNPNAPYETFRQGDPPLSAETLRRENERRAAADASAIERQQAASASLSRLSPRSVSAPRQSFAPFEPRVWELSAGGQFQKLKESVHAAGIPASRETLIEIGKRRFQELLKLNREVRRGDRSVGPSLDLANERVTLELLQARQMLFTPLSGEARLSFKQGARDEVRQRCARIESVYDLWKSTEPEVRALCAYYAALDTLRFGHELAQNIGSDGRVHDERFAADRFSREILAPWLPAFQAQDERVFLVITLFNLESATLAWLSGDERLAEDSALGAAMIPPLAKHVFSVRRPSPDELKKTGGLLASVLHPCDADASRSDELYESWEACGRRGARMSLNDVSNLRPYLATRYPKLGNWQREFLSEALEPINHYGGFKLDQARFRKRVEEVISDTTSAVFTSLALRVNEALEGKAQVVGFVGETIVVESPAKSGEALKVKIDFGLKELVEVRELALVHSIQSVNHLGNAYVT